MADCKEHWGGGSQWQNLGLTCLWVQRTEGQERTASSTHSAGACRGNQQTRAPRTGLWSRSGLVGRNFSALWRAERQLWPPLSARSSPSQAETTKNVFRHCLMSPGRQNHLPPHPHPPVENHCCTSEETYQIFQWARLNYTV